MLDIDEARIQIWLVVDDLKRLLHNSNEETCHLLPQQQKTVESALQAAEMARESLRGVTYRQEAYKPSIN